ncbi:hypothetical protein [Flaviaesturariibacter amylovorans]
MDPEKTGLVPPQEGGGQSNTEASRSFGSEAEANTFFDVLKARLLNVNDWHRMAGAATAVFQLTDAEGLEVDRTVQAGDHFKIDIPGPGSVTGEGFDWVQVEAIDEGEADGAEHLTIRVRPATDPNTPRPDVAHFFSDDATSSFMVRREGTTVTAAVYGRNEKPNTAAEKLVDKARNLAVASGAIAAASKFQWKSLVEGLVRE